MFGKKTLSELTKKDIEKYLKTRGGNRDVNHRIEGKGNLMAMLISGAKKYTRMPF